MNFNFLIPQGPISIVWVTYILIYLTMLYRILSSSRLETNEKILWFFVITLVPLFGLLAYARIAWSKT